MQVARTNRWSALGTVGGLIASGIGANWAAMAISAAASPITLMPITGLLVGGLILLVLSGPSLPPSGSASWHSQAVVSAIAAVVLLGIPSILPAWRDAVVVIVVLYTKARTKVSRKVPPFPTFMESNFTRRLK